MVHLSLIEAQLSQLGIRTSRWFKAEIRELQHILTDHEKIIALVTGRYFGGYAIMVATDQRLLIIDKKVLFLTVEDIRYDMISEVNYNVRLLDATFVLYTINKQHHFTTYKNKQQLRDLMGFVQRRVMELRQYGRQEIPQPQALPLPAPTYSFQTVSMSNPVVAQQVPHVSSVPSADVPQLVGAAAIQNTPWIINPYAKGSLVMRRR